MTSSSSPIVDIPVLGTPFNVDGHSSLSIMIGNHMGQIHEVQVDTGSTGLVVPVSFLTKTGQPDGELADGVISLGPTHIAYEPSGNLIYGCMYLVPSILLGQLPGPKGSAPAFACQTGPVVVFGAHSAGNLSDPTKLEPVGPGLGMLGIGFGRGTPPAAGSSAGTPATASSAAYQLSNLFLSVVEGASEVYPSYMLSSQGSNGTGFITLGLTPDQFQAGPYNGKLLQLLNPQTVTAAGGGQSGQESTSSGSQSSLPANPCNCSTPPAGGWPTPPQQDLPYWYTPTATITITGLNGGQPIPATMLMDTGVTLMMMTLPATGSWQTYLSKATVTIAATDPSQPGNPPIMSYSFTLGGASVSYPINQVETKAGSGAPVQLLATGVPAAPPPVPTFSSNESGFVNTGINLLLAHNYYFDGKTGKLGYGPPQAVPQS